MAAMAERRAISAFLLWLLSMAAVTAALGKQKEQQTWRKVAPEVCRAGSRRRSLTLCLSTVPWCGVSRQLMREVENLFNSELDGIENIKIQWIDLHKNKEHMKLYENVALPVLTFVGKGSESKYSGVLSARAILQAAKYWFKLRRKDLPLHQLSTWGEVHALAEPSLRSIVLVDNCKWSQEILDRETMGHKSLQQKAYLMTNESMEHDGGGIGGLSESATDLIADAEKDSVKGDNDLTAKRGDCSEGKDACLNLEDGGSNQICDNDGSVHAVSGGGSEDGSGSLKIDLSNKEQERGCEMEGRVNLRNGETDDLEWVVRDSDKGGASCSKDKETLDKLEESNEDNVSLEASKIKEGGSESEKKDADNGVSETISAKDQSSSQENTEADQSGSIKCTLAERENFVKAFQSVRGEAANSVFTPWLTAYGLVKNGSILSHLDARLSELPWAFLVHSMDIEPEFFVLPGGKTDIWEWSLKLPRPPLGLLIPEEYPHAFEGEKPSVILFLERAGPLPLTKQEIVFNTFREVARHYAVLARAKAMAAVAKRKLQMQKESRSKTSGEVFERTRKNDGSELVVSGHTENKPSVGDATKAMSSTKFVELSLVASHSIDSKEEGKYLVQEQEEQASLALSLAMQLGLKLLNMDLNVNLRQDIKELGDVREAIVTGPSGNEQNIARERTIAGGQGQVCTKDNSHVSREGEGEEESYNAGLEALSIGVQGTEVGEGEAQPSKDQEGSDEGDDWKCVSENSGKEVVSLVDVTGEGGRREDGISRLEIRKAGINDQPIGGEREDDAKTAKIVRANLQEGGLRNEGFVEVTVDERQGDGVDGYASKGSECSVELDEQKSDLQSDGMGGEGTEERLDAEGERITSGKMEEGDEKVEDLEGKGTAESEETDVWEEIEALKESPTGLLNFFYMDGETILPEKLGLGTEVPSLAIIHPSWKAHYAFPPNVSMTKESIVGFIEAVLLEQVPKTMYSSPPATSHSPPQPSPLIHRTFRRPGRIAPVTLLTFDELVLGRVCNHKVTNEEELFEEDMLSEDFLSARGGGIGYNVGVFQKMHLLNKGKVKLELECELLEASWRDVVVLYTTPWCGFCRRMELVFEETQKSLRPHESKMLPEQRESIHESRREDEEKEKQNGGRKGNIPLLLRMDCTANDCSNPGKGSLQVTGYPTVVLYPAHRKDEARVYDGLSTVKGLLSFMGWSRILQKTPPQGVQEGDNQSKDGSLLEGGRAIKVKVDELQKSRESKGEASEQMRETLKGGSQRPSSKDTTQCKAVTSPQMGSVLIATNQLDASLFEKSVVLLLKVNEGPTGVILNHPINWSEIVTLQPDVRTLLQDAVIGLGGPVLAQIALPSIILTRRRGVPGFIEALPGLFWGTNLEILKSVIELVAKGGAEADEFWFFVGYSGWSESQLKGEIEVGAWHVATCSLETLWGAEGGRFERKEVLWEEVLSHLGRRRQKSLL